MRGYLTQNKHNKGSATVHSVELNRNDENPKLKCELLMHGPTKIQNLFYQPIGVCLGSKHWRVQRYFLSLLPIKQNADISLPVDTMHVYRCLSPLLLNHFFFPYTCSAAANNFYLLPDGHMCKNANVWSDKLSLTYPTNFLMSPHDQSDFTQTKTFRLFHLFSELLFKNSIRV